MSFQEQKDETKVATNLENMDKIAEEFSEARKEFRREMDIAHARHDLIFDEKVDALYQKVAGYIVENHRKIYTKLRRGDYRVNVYIRGNTNDYPCDVTISRFKRKYPKIAGLSVDKVAIVTHLCYFHTCCVTLVYQ